jgi:hypothetical protein
VYFTNGKGKIAEARSKPSAYPRNSASYSSLTGYGMSCPTCLLNGERSAYAPRREFEDWLLSMGIFAAGKLPRADPNTRCLRWREVDESGH